MQRLSELFNINHFIVSQVNPHVIPFISSSSSLQQHGTLLTSPLVKLIQFLSSELNSTLLNLLHINPFPMHAAAIYMLDQKYVGDITLVPNVTVSDYTALLTNPTTQRLHECIAVSEKETWKLMAIIRGSCEIEFTLDECVRRMRGALILEELSETRKKMSRVRSWTTEFTPAPEAEKQEGAIAGGETSQAESGEEDDIDHEAHPLIRAVSAPSPTNFNPPSASPSSLARAHSKRHDSAAPSSSSPNSLARIRTSKATNGLVSNSDEVIAVANAKALAERGDVNQIQSRTNLSPRQAEQVATVEGEAAQQVTHHKRSTPTHRSTSGNTSSSTSPSAPPSHDLSSSRELNHQLSRMNTSRFSRDLDIDSHHSPDVLLQQAGVIPFPMAIGSASSSSAASAIQLPPSSQSASFPRLSSATTVPIFSVSADSLPTLPRPSSSSTILDLDNLVRQASDSHLLGSKRIQHLLKSAGVSSASMLNLNSAGSSSGSGAASRNESRRESDNEGEEQSQRHQYQSQSRVQSSNSVGSASSHGSGKSSVNRVSRASSKNNLAAGTKPAVSFAQSTVALPPNSNSPVVSSSISPASTSPRHLASPATFIAPPLPLSFVNPSFSSSSSSSSTSSVNPTFPSILFRPTPPRHMSAMDLSKLATSDEDEDPEKAAWNRERRSKYKRNMNHATAPSSRSMVGATVMNHQGWVNHSEDDDGTENEDDEEGTNNVRIRTDSDSVREALRGTDLSPALTTNLASQFPSTHILTSSTSPPIQSVSSSSSSRSVRPRRASGGSSTAVSAGGGGGGMSSSVVYPPHPSREDRMRRALINATRAGDEQRTFHSHLHSSSQHLHLHPHRHDSPEQEGVTDEATESAAAAAAATATAVTATTSATQRRKSKRTARHTTASPRLVADMNEVIWNQNQNQNQHQHQ